MLSIDALEDELAPLGAGSVEVRELISTLELCHHKAARWVENAIEAIGAGTTSKGLGTREPGRLHAAEQLWQAAADALAAWCAGSPPDAVQGTVGGVAAAELVARIGDRTPLKEWQVQRVIEKIRSLIHWPPASDDPSAGYTWMLLDDGSDGSMYRTSCPLRYAEHEAFWRATVHTIVRDAQDGNDAPLSLGLAIDMLWPCHWNFLGNLEIVLDAIGLELDPERPFAACGRNIGRLPNRHRFERISRTLQAFAGETQSAGDEDDRLVALLGTPSPEKQWLARSLDKTIRLQLDPPAELRAIFALPGPKWLSEAIEGVAD
jgi:hypothetical protein